MINSTLNVMKLITSIVAPILTFVLALLGAITEMKRDKKYRSGGISYTKRKLTPYGKAVITLLIISALLTLSGVWVDGAIAKQKDQDQKDLDAINNKKRDSILHIALSTLSSVATTLDTTKSTLRTARSVQSSAIEMTRILDSQTNNLKRLSIPLFPMEIKYSFERTEKLSGPIAGVDQGISGQDIIDAMHRDLGPPRGNV